MRSWLSKPLVHDALIVISALAFTALFVAVADSGFPLDDSWIHQTYARNLAATGQWSYVAGVPSVASTAPFYTVLLSVAYTLGIPYALWTHTLGAAALAITGLVARRLALRAAPGSLWVGLAAGLACVLSWHLIWAAASGMDTSFAAMWSLVLLWLTWREIDAASPPAWLRAVTFGVVSGLAMLTRPELVLLTGLCGLGLLFVRPQRSFRAMFGWLTIAALAWAVVMLPYFLLNLQVAGSLLPSTNAAKQTQLAPRTALPLLERYGNIVLSLLVGAQILLLVGLVMYCLRFARRLRNDRGALLFLIAPVWVAALPLLYAVWLPFWEQHGRYVIPAVPALMVTGVVGLGWLVAASRENRLSRVTVTTLALSAVVILLAFAVFLGPVTYKRDVALINEEMVDPAHWIVANVPLDVPLATHDIGAIGFFAPRPLLDVAGLISPEVVPLLHDAAGMWSLFEERGIVYLMALEDQVPGGDYHDPRLCPVYASAGETALAADLSKMTIYRLAYDGQCS